MTLEPRVVLATGASDADESMPDALLESKLSAPPDSSTTPVPEA